MMIGGCLCDFVDFLYFLWVIKVKRVFCCVFFVFCGMDGIMESCLFFVFGLVMV